MSEEDDLIDGQYQFVMGIATGSGSVVQEVVEKASGRHLAMKILKKDVPEFKENKAQLRRESEIMKLLDHPQIIKFERYSSNRDHTYILMEYFRASNLKLQIKAETNKVHLRIRPLFEGVCSALSHVHQKGFIHRDIKPDNILLNRVGEVRLCDFSLSSKQKKGLGKMLAGKLKTIQGTRTYIAPETIRRQQPTIQTDLYSLGVLFFEVLTCRTPFQAPTPEELLHKHLKSEAPNPSESNPNVSPEMDRIIARLLKKKPADRPASVDEVLAELKRIRIFKEDIVDEALTKQANEDANFMAMVSEARLDSRADAKLKQMLATNAEFAAKFHSEKQEKEVKKKAEKERTRKRIEAAEDVQARKVAASPAGIAAAAATAAAAAQASQPQPQPMMPQPMPMMPMQMPGYSPGYPQGYAPYPQAPMPMMPMPMQPGMNQVPPGMPQYPGQPQAVYQQPAPQPVAQQGPVPSAPKPTLAQQPGAPNPQPTAQRSTTAPPKPQAPKQPAARQPQTAPQAPPARQAPPAAPARPLPSPIARPVARATPASPENADLEYMTDLPDVL